MPENNGNSGKTGSSGFGSGNSAVNGNSGNTVNYNSGNSQTGNNTNNRIGEMTQKPEKMPEKKKIITDWGDEEDLDAEIENEKNIQKPNNNNISPKQGNFSVINPNNTGSKNSLNGMEKSKNSSTASFISENSQKSANVRTFFFNWTFFFVEEFFLSIYIRFYLRLFFFFFSFFISSLFLYFFSHHFFL
jgi:hypothetical protein